MTGPDDYRGSPAGGSWRPPGPGSAGPPPSSPAGWAPDPNRPGPAWPAAVTGPGGSYVGPGGYGSGVGSAGFSAPAGQSGAASRAKLGPARLFGLVIAVLGALNFVFGFLPQLTASQIDESLSVYAVGPGYVPILLLIAGLLALAAFLPGSERSRLAVAAVSVGGAVGALISLGTTGSVEMLTTAQVSKGMGAVLLTIFGIIQAVVAIAAYVVGADFGARPGSVVVTVAADPATARHDAGPPRPAGMAGDVVWTAEGPVRSTPWSAPAAGSTPGPVWGSTPGSTPQGSAAYYAGYAPAPGSTGWSGGPAGSGPTASGWAPPADDDRPTGPQQVVDTNADDPASPARQAPAERELPRVAPVGVDKPSASTTPAPDDDSVSEPTEVYRIPPRPSMPEDPGRS